LGIWKEPLRIGIIVDAGTNMRQSIEPRYQDSGRENRALTFEKFWSQVMDFDFDLLDIKLDCDETRTNHPRTISV
jgi:hypothetical protein